MAEILYSNGYISSSMRARDLMLVSTLWFSMSRNLMMSSDLKLDEQKTRWRTIWWKFGIKMVISRVLWELETCYWCRLYDFQDQ